MIAGQESDAEALLILLYTRAPEVNVRVCYQRHVSVCIFTVSCSVSQ